MTVRTCVVLIAVFAASCTAAEPTTTTEASTTTTVQSTTTTTVPSVYWVPEDSDALAWARDALAYAVGASTPPRQPPDPTSRIPQPVPRAREVFPASADAVRHYGRTMCQLLVSGTEAQVEATMRLDLGVRRWEDYGVAWFDSLVNGLCVRR
jgi:hypothetical protein